MADKLTVKRIDGRASGDMADQFDRHDELEELRKVVELLAQTSGYCVCNVLATAKN